MKQTVNTIFDHVPNASYEYEINVSEFDLRTMRPKSIHASPARGNAAVAAR